MIVGLGHDLCDAKRIERVIDRFGTRFLERVFTNTERERFTNSLNLDTHSLM